MRVIRTPLAGLVPGERQLAIETSRYLCRVLRLDVGALLVVFDPEGRVEAEAEVLVASATEAVIRIGEVRPARVVARTDLVLVYALAKSDRIDTTIRDATELGATRIVLTQASRSVARATDRIEQKRERWTRIVEQAARQCGRADPPSIDGVFPWDEALAAVGPCDACFCLHPAASEGLGASLVALARGGASMAFAIGPEGGLDRSEIETARTLGFRPVSLGPFVLRTETVAAAVLGAVRVLGWAPEPDA